MSSIKHVLLFLLIFLFLGCLQKETETGDYYLEDEQDDTDIAIPPGTFPIDEKIKKTLVGHELVYYNIAGFPMNYTITEEDIVAIEETTLNGKPAWKVKLGEEGLTWEIYLDSSGEEILKEVQLFVT
jgi:hypothetical protein